jgi:hypothetical protein
MLVPGIMRVLVGFSKKIFIVLLIKMFLSGSFLKQSLEKYKTNKTTRATEGYSGMASASAGMSAAMDSFTLVVAVIFLGMELILLFFSITIAMYCSKTPQERIVNLVLATMFTAPYMLLNILFNPCAKKVLQGGLRRPRKN